MVGEDRWQAAELHSARPDQSREPTAVVLVATLQLDRDADVTNRLLGVLCRLSHSALPVDRLQLAQCHIEHYYPADTGGSNLLGGGATAAAVKYIVPTQIQKTVKLKGLEPFKNNLLAVYSILF